MYLHLICGQNTKPQKAMGVLSAFYLSFDSVQICLLRPVLPPMKIGMLPKTLVLLSTSSVPSGSSASWRHAIRQGCNIIIISNFFPIFFLKWLVHYEQVHCDWCIRCYWLLHSFSFISMYQRHRKLVLITPCVVSHVAQLIIGWTNNPHCEEVLHPVNYVFELTQYAHVQHCLWCCALFRQDVRMLRLWSIIKPCWLANSRWLTVIIHIGCMKCMVLSITC